MPSTRAEHPCIHCSTNAADQIERIGIVGREGEKVCVKYWCNACARSFYIWRKDAA